MVLSTPGLFYLKKGENSPAQIAGGEFLGLMESQLRKALAGLPLGEIRYFDSAGSTNDLALDWAASGAPDFSLVLADEQTSGRGRMGRKWFTPPGAGLALSMVLRLNDSERENIGLFSGLGALALVDALKNYGIVAQVKWPNDVLINRKKVAGVLVETAWMGADVEALVLGIGVNVTPESLPPEVELNFPATCVQSETVVPVGRFGLLRRLADSLVGWRPRLGTDAFLDAWRASLAFGGETVQVWGAKTETIVGVLDGLEADGSLRVVANGERQVVHFGEIRLRPL
jgi:BirA family transcriptional regulator, biotin operon repressor / biotin---[acetyl-CoA-carboxylase] ligase